MGKRREHRRLITKPGRVKKAWLLLIYFISYVLYLYWRARYTLPFEFGIVSAVCGVMLYVAELAGFIECGIFYLTLWDIGTAPTPAVQAGKEYPHIDVFIATYNEPVELLYKTIIGCRSMDYPDKSRVHIYICDDGRRPEMAALCEKLEVGYITRSENLHAKAGNLNNALKQTDSPYIVTFDADMIPMSDFLLKTVPFFMQHERVGFVQVPQNFYNPDEFQYNLFQESDIPNEQDLFSRMIQAGKCRFNAAIYAGSNTMLSRAALDEIGGLVVGTITEDFATGMKLQSRGYKTFYVNEIHASGLSPDNLEDLFNQRIRWGRGVIQTFKKYNPLTQKGLNIWQKLMYFSAASYWYFGIWRTIFFMAPILYAVFGIVVLHASAQAVLGIWLPMFVLSGINFRVFTNGVRTTVWSHIYDTILFPQITMGVLLETFGIRMEKFKVTPKETNTHGTFINKFKMVSLQILIAALSLTGIGRIIYNSVVHGFYTAYLINLFWLIYNSYLLIIAIFFASERPKFRSSERQSIHTRAWVQNGEQKLVGETFDISEDGVSIVLQKPYYLDPEGTHPVYITTGRYTARCSAQIVRVDPLRGMYKYVFRFEVDEPNYQQLLGILYDRVPPAPQRMGRDRFLNNIVRNIRNRRKRIQSLNRKLPRIPIRQSYVAICDNRRMEVFMEDFNYVCCKLRAPRRCERMQLSLGNDVVFDLRLDRVMEGKKGRGSYVFEIVNYQEFLKYPADNLFSRNSKHPIGWEQVEHVHI